MSEKKVRAIRKAVPKPPSAPPVELVPTGKITAEQLKYFKKVEATAAQSRAYLQQVEQQLAQAQNSHVAAVGAYNSWFFHLCDEYGLDRTADRIDTETGETMQKPKSPVDESPEGAAKELEDELKARGKA